MLSDAIHHPTNLLPTDLIRNMHSFKQILISQRLPKPAPCVFPVRIAVENPTAQHKTQSRGPIREAHTQPNQQTKNPLFCSRRSMAQTLQTALSHLRRVLFQAFLAPPCDLPARATCQRERLRRRTTKRREKELSRVRRMQRGVHGAPPVGFDG